MDDEGNVDMVTEVKAASAYYFTHLSAILEQFLSEGHNGASRWLMEGTGTYF